MMPTLAPPSLPSLPNPSNYGATSLYYAHLTHERDRRALRRAPATEEPEEQEQACAGVMYSSRYTRAPAKTLPTGQMTTHTLIKH